MTDVHGTPGWCIIGIGIVLDSTLQHIYRKTVRCRLRGRQNAPYALYAHNVVYLVCLLPLVRMEEQRRALRTFRPYLPRLPHRRYRLR